MIVQSRRAQVGFFLLSIACVLALGILSYTRLLHSRGYSVEEAKFSAETILFLCFIFAGLLILLFGLILLRNRNIIKELDKIIEMSLYTNFSPTRGLEKLSVMGDKIGQLYRNLNTLNEKRALKISSLSALNDFLLRNIPLSALVIDIRGEIVSASKTFHEKFPDQTDVKGKDFFLLYPDSNIQTVLEKLRDNYSSVSEKAGKTEFTFYPIRNREGEISYIVCLLGRGAMMQQEREKSAKVQAEETPRKKIFRRFLLGGE